MALTLYGLSKCSTCKKAVAWLDERDIAHEFIDYRNRPLASPQLQAWAEELGGWPKLVNRASMTWRNLAPEKKDPQTVEAWLSLIADYPALVRRPVVWDGKTVSVGFNDKKFSARFG